MPIDALPAHVVGCPSGAQPVRRLGAAPLCPLPSESPSEKKEEEEEVRFLAARQKTEERRRMAAEAEAEDQRSQEEDKKRRTEQEEEDRAALRRAAGTLDELGPRSSADLARALMTQRTSQAAAQAGRHS